MIHAHCEPSCAQSTKVGATNVSEHCSSNQATSRATVKSTILGADELANEHMPGVYGHGYTTKKGYHYKQNRVSLFY